jgi:hypothetical protein
MVNIPLSAEICDKPEFIVVDVKPGRGKLAWSAKKVILRLADGRKFGATIQGDRPFGDQLLLTTTSAALRLSNSTG